MQRLNGPIPTIKEARYPNRFIVFDTEAFISPPVDGVELQTLRLGVAVFVELDKDLNPTVKDWFDFTTVEGLQDFIEYCGRKDRTLYVYAHNLKYDLQLSGLYNVMVSEGWTNSLFVIEDPPTFIKLKRGRFSVTFVDTFNYWQYGLKAMGDQLGLDKLTVDFTNTTNEQLLLYCKRDVEVLLSYLLTFLHFLDENDLCGLGLTLASQAFRSYRYRFMKTPIVLHNRAEVLDLERAGYMGGRCEAFHIGKVPGDDFYKLDVNSMYPYVMKEKAYPVELVSYSEDTSLLRLDECLSEYYCLADCEIITSTPEFAVNSGPKLIFPVGRYRVILHHPDLVKVRGRGAIIQVKRLAAYRAAPIFSAYVSFFYTLKLDAEKRGDPITRHQAKILLNSLYGKFGQRQVISKVLPLQGEGKFGRLIGFSEALGQRVEVNYLGNSAEVRYKAGEAFYSSPVIAGAVTSYARSYLWDLIVKAGRSNVYYVDTDSLIVNREGYANLTPYLDLKRLGALKLEGRSSCLTIYGAKDYVFGDEVKVKGVPHTAVKLSDNQWEYKQFRGGKTWINQGMPVGVEVYTRLKQRKSAYDKGEVLPDGRVLPLGFGLGEGREVIHRGLGDLGGVDLSS